MTDVVARLRQLEAAATPGPWHVATHPPFGALEAHSMIVEASAEKIADALHDVAEAIRGA